MEEARYNKNVNFNGALPQFRLSTARNNGFPSVIGVYNTTLFATRRAFLYGQKLNKALVLIRYD